MATTSTPSILPAPFPAPSKTTSGVVNGLLTTVTSISFTDKLLITTTGPSGKLAHWVHVSLATSSTDPTNPSFTANSASSDPNSLLPRPDLTATTVLGGTKREDEVIGQTLATTIASAILVKRPREERMLVLGFGLQGIAGRDGFEEVVGLVLDVL